jgi:hypothetical protein
MRSGQPKHLLDTDPSTMPPLCDPDDFAALIQEMVDYETPRLFAIVHEYGDRVDAEVAGWGLCFADRAIAFNDEGVTVSMRSVENAVRLFQGGPNVTAHLCWPGPPAR